MQKTKQSQNTMSRVKTMNTTLLRASLVKTEVSQVLPVVPVFGNISLALVSLTVSVLDLIVHVPKSCLCAGVSSVKHLPCIGNMLVFASPPKQQTKFILENIH